MGIVKYDNFLPQKSSSGDQQRYQLYRFVATKSTAKEGTTAVKHNVDKIVLIMDVSGSMWHLMDMLKNAILSTVDLIIARQICPVKDIVLITFGSTVEVRQGFETIEELQIYVLHISDLGGTDYNVALSSLLKVTQMNENVVAVMFSDGEPNEINYVETIEELRQLGEKQCLLIHAIGMFGPVSESDTENSDAEAVLRSLVSAGSEEGYYQSIEESELEDSMKVLVDHFIPENQRLQVNKIPMRSDGFFVEKDDQEDFLVENSGTQPEDEILKCTDVRTFDDMLQSNRFDEVLSAFGFLLQFYLRSVKSCDLVLNIIETISSKMTQLKDAVESKFNEERIALGNTKANQFKQLKSGCNVLKEKSQIIAQYNRQLTTLLKDHRSLLAEFTQMNELCGSLSERLHLRQNIKAPSDDLADEIRKAVSKFRDNTIALKRKKLAKFSRKLQERNTSLFGNIDELLQMEINKLDVEFVDSEIPVPKHLENYVDPVTLNDIREVMLDTFGVFMLVLNVERHDAGIVAPHRTKIVEVCSYTSCVLNSMMQQGEQETNLVIDFRGVGQGNAAVPLWINELHWRKARHVFAPFVAHAITGNEMEYSKLQGQTILALILLHFRRQQRQQQQHESSEYNQRIIQMVGETLAAVVEKDRWMNVMKDVTNSEQSLNEEKIPSVDVFLTFLEYIPSQPHQYEAEKFHLLIAEDYNRRNGWKIKEKYDEYMGVSTRGKSRRRYYSANDDDEDDNDQNTEKKRKLKKASRRRYVLLNSFPRVCLTYLNYSNDDVAEAAKAKAEGEGAGSRKRKTVKNYAKYCILENEKYLAEECDKLTKKQSAGASLAAAVSKLSCEQTLAIVLSVHKCVCFGWDAFAGAGIPSGYSTSPEYRDLLRNWCEVKKNQNTAELTKQNEDCLLALLRARDVQEATPLIQNVKRNSLAWGVLLKVLFQLDTAKPVAAAAATTDDQQPSQIEAGPKLPIPLQFELIMYCIFNSFDPADYRADKVMWRPKSGRRHRFEKMYSSALVTMSDWF